MGEATKVASGRPVLELDVDLLHRQPGPHRVDRHPRLDAEAARDGKDRLACLRTQPPLAREGLAHLPPTGGPDERAGGALGEPEATADARAERRDDDVGAGGQQRTQVAAQVGVAEEERAGLHLFLRERQRLSLAAPREADDLGAGGLGDRRRPVPRAVVGDDDRRLGELIAQGLDRGADPLLLVSSRDEDGQAWGHCCAAAGGIAGRTPSFARSPRP